MGAAECGCKKPSPAEDAVGEVAAEKGQSVQPLQLLEQRALQMQEKIEGKAEALEIERKDTTATASDDHSELTPQASGDESDFQYEVSGAGSPITFDHEAPASCTLTQDDHTVGDHVVPVVGLSSVGYFLEKDKISKLLDASGEDLGRNFSLHGSSIAATKQGASGGFACAVSDPCVTDCPLVFVSDGFADLTGYTSDFATGRSCRFLQPTSKALNDAINLEERKVMREFCSFLLPAGTTIINLLLNQRFTGERFWNLLRMQYVVVDGDCYIFAVQTNLDSYMPKCLLKAVKGAAKNASIVKELGPFIGALDKMRESLRTMTAWPMLELKGYFTASLNLVHQLINAGPAASMTSTSSIASTVSNVDVAPAQQSFKVGEVIEVLLPIKYPSFALAKGSSGTITAMDSFGNIVVEWGDTKYGTKGVLKRDFDRLKSLSAPAVGDHNTLHATWQKLYDSLSVPKGAEKAEGVANNHSQSAREEIARKLIVNHRAVIKDLTNTSKTKNIEDKPLTQTHLVRIDIGSKAFVDQMLREVARRLLGKRPGLASYAEKPEQGDAEQSAAWRGTAIYLAGRVQSKREQKPGRKPDMSEEACAAFLAVLEEVAALTCQSKADIKSLSVAISESRATVDGATTPQRTPRLSQKSPQTTPRRASVP